MNDYGRFWMSRSNFWSGFPVSSRDFLAAADALGCPLNVFGCGPCSDRTYDQLIKRSVLKYYISIDKTVTYGPQTVPQFHARWHKKLLN
jgi:hypothetical protein